MRILVLGHYKLDRLLGPLLARGATEIVLWSDIDPGHRISGASFRWIHMNRQTSAEGIIELLDSVKPDVCLANVSGLGEEQLILTYALAAEQLGRREEFCWHPPAFAELCVDKAAFQRTAISLGLPVPDGGVAECVAEVARIVHDLGGPPVVLKAARAQAKEGVYLAQTPASLASILARDDLRFPLVIQRKVAGEEIGIEVLSIDGISCRFPVASTGDMDSGCDPAIRVRSAPRALPPMTMVTVQQILDTIEERLEPCGPWQLDMALIGQDVSILEMNGRLGGLSDLGLGSTGHDSHELLCDLVMGISLPRPRPRVVAMEIPVAVGLIPPAGSDGVQISVLRDSPANPYPAGSDYRRLSLRSADRAAVGSWVGRLNAAALLAPLHTVWTQVDRAFHGLESAGKRLADTDGGSRHRWS